MAGERDATVHVSVGGEQKQKQKQIKASIQFAPCILFGS